MNLGAMMAAGGVALSGLNDYNRQAEQDSYAKLVHDQTIEKGKLDIAAATDQATERKTLLDKQARFDRARARAAQELGDQTFGAPGANSPPNNGVTGADVALPPSTPAPMPDLAGAPIDAAPLPVPAGAPPAQAQPLPLPAASGILPAATPPAAGRGPAAGIPAVAGMPGGMSPPGAPGKPVVRGAPGAPGTAPTPGPASSPQAFDRMYRIGKEENSPEFMEQAIQGFAQAARYQYTQALDGATAALAQGDARPFVSLYNSRYPNGHRIADMRTLADGGVVISEYGPNAKLKERVVTKEQMEKSLIAMRDPAAWVKMAEEHYKQQEQGDREVRVDGVKQKGALDVANVKEAGDDRRNAANIAKDYGVEAMRVKSAKDVANINTEKAVAVAELKAQVASAGKVNPIAKEASTQVYNILKSDPMGGMTSENAELAKHGAAALAAEYATGKDGAPPMEPAAAAARAVREVAASIKADKGKVPVPAARGSPAMPGSPASGVVSSSRFGY